jgi:hypothetical protein
MNCEFRQPDCLLASINLDSEETASRLNESAGLLRGRRGYNCDNPKGHGGKQVSRCSIVVANGNGFAVPGVARFALAHWG